MAINPEEIKLTPEQRERLARIAEQSGQPWQELLEHVLGKLPGQRPNGPVAKKSAYDLLNEAGLIGCIDGGPADVSGNPQYMQGFGERANEQDTG